LPVVLFLDEVDALVGDTLISVLRQLRAGYNDRPAKFPQSIVLCGVRDVRDYRIQQGDGQVITGGSAFNIKAESLRMGDFTEEETRALWLQHTADTGQRFDDPIWPELWADTRGQPWLVNALGNEATWKTRANRDRGRAITLASYQEARENLIQSRATHLDQLTDKLAEPRVHNVIAALLAGEDDELRVPQADLDYVKDLGLIRDRPRVEISNRIYQEVIPRDLTYSTQVMIGEQETEWYVTPDHRLDMAKLLVAFQQFFREHFAAWSRGFQYEEAGPQLLLQAFLQRIVNGGGHITREYGLGRRRTDLLVEWPLDPGQGLHGPLQRIVVELKVRRRDALDTVIDKGLHRAAGYADTVGADETHLIVFQPDAGLTWEERLWDEPRTFEGRTVHVWGA
jgi:hypothetical protein